MIPQQIPVKNHYGNNSATNFDFDFYVENEEQLSVMHTDLDGNITELEQGVDFKINSHSIGYSEGGNITFPIDGSKYGVLAWNESTGEKELLTIALNLPIEQPAEYNISGDLNKKNLEYSFDYLTRIVQILSRQVERAVKVGEGIDIDTDKLVWNINMAIEHLENIDTVAQDRANIDAVADNKNHIDTVAEHIANVDTVSGHIANVDTVAGHIANVDTVSGHITNVDKVATSIANVDKVGNDIVNVNAVAANKANIDNVAGNKANIDNVAGNKTNINNCASHMNQILDAPNQAQIATNKAATATEQATKAETQADKTTVALEQAEALRNSVAVLSMIDCGTPDDIREVYNDAGTLDDMYVNYIDCGTPDDIYLSNDDMTNILNLPLFHKHVEEIENNLDAATERIGINEDKIADVNYNLEILNIDMDAAVQRIEKNENDIDELQTDLIGTHQDLLSVTERVSENEVEIAELQELTNVFSYIDCGTPDDIRNEYYDAGTLDARAEKYFDFGSPLGFFISRDDLSHIGEIPVIGNMVKTLDKLMQSVLTRLDSLEDGIDCGLVAYNR